MRVLVMRRLRPTTSCVLALLLGAVSAASAQENAVVVPAGHASTEAVGTEFWAFSPFAALRPRSGRIKREPPAHLARGRAPGLDREESEWSRPPCF